MCLRCAQYLIIGCVCGVATVLSVRGNAGDAGAGAMACLWLILGAAVLYGRSWLLSIRFYEKRELR